MMPIKNFDELIAKVKGGDKKTVAAYSGERRPCS